MTPNRARLSNITHNVVNLHGALNEQHKRIAKLEKQLEAVHAQMQNTTPKRTYTTIQDSSPEDTIYCHTDLQEIIEEMFPQVADVLCFISDHEAETHRYYAKKQRCNAEHPAQPTNTDILGQLADRM